MEDIKEYCKKLDSLIAKGLYIDEAEEVIDGKCTLEEALRKHNAFNLYEDAEDNYVKMETAEDADRLMRIVDEIAASKAE